MPYNVENSIAKPQAASKAPRSANDVRTRFAPSPTGYLHIGGVRTALFNWLFARKHGGQFILRIDDTDQQRNVEAALQPILDGFRWLGIDWDEGAEVGGPHGPYYQSQKLERYQAAVRELVDKGLAYCDYATPEESQGREGSGRTGEAAEALQPPLDGRDGRRRAPVRGRGPQGGGAAEDAARGRLPSSTTTSAATWRVEWASEQDHVIQRADGSCLYNLANVVDDYDMKITHVIRAEEHLSNTPRQIFIARGPRLPAARVRPRAVRRRAGQQEQAEQAQDRRST